LAGMWAGMPTIATPIGGFKEQLYHDINALIMKDISSTSLTECIIELANSPHLYARLAEGAHLTAEKLSWPVVADNWHELYEQLWSEARSPRTAT
jgi:glycosyltransferase involved in cell wall biosynthesis